MACLTLRRLGRRYWKRDLGQAEPLPLVDEFRFGVGIEADEFFRVLGEVQEILEFEPEQYVAQGERVVVLGRFRMRLKSGGIEVVSDWAHVWTLRAGQVVQFYEYVDTATVSRAHTEAARYRRAA